MTDFPGVVEQAYRTANDRDEFIKKLRTESVNEMNINMDIYTLFEICNQCWYGGYMEKVQEIDES